MILLPCRETSVGALEPSMRTAASPTGTDEIEGIVEVVVGGIVVEVVGAAFVGVVATRVVVETIRAIDACPTGAAVVSTTGVGGNC